MVNKDADKDAIAECIAEGEVDAVLMTFKLCVPLAAHLLALMADVSCFRR